MEGYINLGMVPRMYSVSWMDGYIGSLVDYFTEFYFPFKF